MEVVKTSILENTSSNVEFFTGGDGRGQTGFSKLRYTIPEADGYAIYLDSDVIVFGDIAELWELRQPGKLVGSESRQKQTGEIVNGSMPMVLDRRVKASETLAENISRGLYVRRIPEVWNHCDYMTGDTKLLHLTRQHRQPWNPKAACDRAIDRLWWYYRDSILS